jgi:beta-N-acetylhexosaminidase
MKPPSAAAVFSMAAVHAVSFFTAAAQAAVLSVPLGAVCAVVLSACTTGSPDPFGHSGPEDLLERDLRGKIAQMLLVGFRGLELTQDNPVYGDIAKLGIGGVLLFDYDMPSKSRPRNIRSREQLTRLTAELQAAAPIRLFIAIDQEGGRVNRLRGEYGFPPSLGAKEMAADPSGELTNAQADETARLLSQMGINVNFAPCVDLDLNRQNPIIGAYGRSFSPDPEAVITHAAIWIDAHRRRGIFSAIKHFPGHGSSRSDTHRGSVDVTGLWQETELIPYRRLITSPQGRDLMVMTSHVFNANLDPQNPATLSRPILTELLRDKLGFRGIIVSDDLNMAAITAHHSFEETLEKAINAGVDLLCFSNNGGRYDPLLAKKAVDGIFRLVEEGKISRKRIEESWDRIMAAKQKL